jgi:hypothetical protein
MPFSGADSDGDGTVDPGDYVVWRTNFGELLSGSGSGQAASSASQESAVAVEQSMIEDATRSAATSDNAPAATDPSPRPASVLSIESIQNSHRRFEPARGMSRVSRPAIAGIWECWNDELSDYLLAQSAVRRRNAIDADLVIPDSTSNEEVNESLTTVDAAFSVDDFAAFNIDMR